MYIPKLDQRNKNDILDEIKSCSKNYTPEWNFDVQNPDMGTATALAATRLYCDTIDKYNQTAENNYIEFFRRLGAEPLYETPATGYAAFEISENMDSTDGELINYGEMLYGDGEDKTRIPYMIDIPIYVVNNRICHIVYNDTVEDEIYELYHKEDGTDTIENIKVYDKNRKNLQSHEMYICCQCFDDMRGNEKGMIFAVLDRAGNRQLKEFLRCLCNCDISYYSNGTFVPCQNCHIEEDRDLLVFSFDYSRLPTKTTIQEIEGYWIKILLSPIRFFENIYIRELRIGTMADKCMPDAILDDDGELEKSRFRPFGQNPIPYSSVYFVCDSVLSNKGARISLSFGVNYERTPIYEMEEADAPEWKFVMKKNKFKKPKEYDVTIASVVWEYFNGYGWMRLFERDSYYDVFSGQNGGQIIRMEFTCPKDMVKVFLPMGEGYCIRARISAVDNYMKQNGYYVTPVVTDVLFSYKYDRLPLADKMITKSSLESRLFDMGEQQDSVKCAWREKENTDSIYFAFEKELTYSGMHIFFSVDSDHRNIHMDCVWEYFSEEGWQEFPCVDRTRGLTESGLLTLKKKIHSKQTSLFHIQGYFLRLRFLPNNGLRRCMEGKAFHRICLNTTRIINIEQKLPEYFVVNDNHTMDCQLSSSNIYKAEVYVDELPVTSAIGVERLLERGNTQAVYAEDGSLRQLWVKWKEEKRVVFDQEHEQKDQRTYFLDRDYAIVSFGNGAGKPPVHESNENVLVKYSICSGKKGNMREGTRLNLEETRSFISGVYCPVELSGGFDKDDTVKTLERSADRLRMIDRVCTAEDFEDMSSLLYRGIVKVKCLENRNLHGKNEPGAVTLVVLLKNMNEFESAGIYLKDELLRRCSAGMKASAFHIVRPKVLLVDISIEIKVEPGRNIYEARTNVYDRMAEYFDYETDTEGCPDWEIGDIPQRVNVRNFISSIDAVGELRNFYMACFLEGDGGVDELTDKELLELKETKMTIARLRKLEIFHA